MGGKNTPSPFLPLYLQYGKRYGDAILRHCPGLRRLFITYKLLWHRCRKCEHGGLETGSTFEEISEKSYARFYCFRLQATKVQNAIRRPETWDIMKLVICEQDICKIHAKRLTSKQLLHYWAGSVRSGTKNCNLCHGSSHSRPYTTDYSKLELASMTLVKACMVDSVEEQFWQLCHMFLS